MSSVSRKPTNLSLDPSLVGEAKALSINLSQASEAGIRDAVKAVKAARWREENGAAVEGYNRWVAENGLPLDRYRRF